MKLVNSKPCDAPCVSMRIRVNMRRKQYFPFSISKQSRVSLFSISSHFVSQNITHLSLVFPKIDFFVSVPLSAFFFKFHISPTTRKLLVRLRLLSAGGTNLSARGPGCRASPNLTACLQGPSTPRLTRHSPGRLISLNLTGLFMRSVHCVLCMLSPNIQVLSANWKWCFRCTTALKPFLQVLSANLEVATKSSHLISFHFISQNFISFLSLFSH